MNVRPGDGIVGAVIGGMIVGLAWVATETARSSAPLSSDAVTWCPAQIEPRTYPGFYTGNTYRTDPLSMQLAYLGGISDGMLAAGLYGNADARWLYSCTAGMELAQMHVVVDRWLGQHPEAWHFPMNGLVNKAMSEACSR